VLLGVLRYLDLIDSTFTRSRAWRGGALAMGQSKLLRISQTQFWIAYSRFSDSAATSGPSFSTPVAAMHAQKKQSDAVRGLSHPLIPRLCLLLHLSFLLSDGGALLIDSVPSPLVVSACAFVDGAASSGGFIAFHSSKGTPVVSVQDCSFDNGTAARSGGAIFSQSAEVEILSSTSARTFGEWSSAQDQEEGTILPATHSSGLLDCSAPPPPPPPPPPLPSPPYPHYLP